MAIKNRINARTEEAAALRPDAGR